MLSIGLLAGLMGCQSVSEVDTVDMEDIQGFRAGAERGGMMVTLDFTKPPHFVFVSKTVGKDDAQIHTSVPDVPNAKRVYRYVSSGDMDGDGNRFVRHSYECGDYRVAIMTDIAELTYGELSARPEELPFCLVRFTSPNGTFTYDLEQVPD